MWSLSSSSILVVLLLSCCKYYHAAAFCFSRKNSVAVQGSASKLSFFPEATSMWESPLQSLTHSTNNMLYSKNVAVFDTDNNYNPKDEASCYAFDDNFQNKLVLLERAQVFKVLFAQAIALTSSTMQPITAFAVDETNNLSSLEVPQVLLTAPKQIKQLYSDGLAKQIQGNIIAAQRIFAQVTKLAPEFVYGWSNLGNTQVALGSLKEAEESYTKSIELCKIKEQQIKDNVDNRMFGIKGCDDLYILYLNRGTTRLALDTTPTVKKDALEDIEKAALLRGQPDVLVYQNRARGRELNGLYTLADSDYDVAISMSKDGVAPYWLRAALVKFQLNRYTEALSLVRRVEQRFPEAPEVRATLASLYSAMGDPDGARRKFLEIPTTTRLLYSDPAYLTQTIAWPPLAQYHITQVAKDVGDAK